MKKKAAVPHAEAVARAALPEILFLSDLRFAGRYSSDSGARRALLRGEWGPPLRLGRRWAVLRDDALEALRARAVLPPGAAAAGPVPAEAPAWARNLLAPPRRGRRQ